MRYGRDDWIRVDLDMIDTIQPRRRSHLCPETAMLTALDTTKKDLGRRMETFVGSHMATGVLEKSCTNKRWKNISG